MAGGGVEKGREGKRGGKMKEGRERRQEKMKTEGELHPIEVFRSRRLTAVNVFVC